MTTVDAAARLLDLLRARGLTIATAESCTGGLVSAALTAVPGCSDVVLGGIVTYSNGMKASLLGVPEEVLRRVGAVSEDCAREMATGLLRATGAGLGISVTGIAGPGGGSAEKPVGLVYIGVSRPGGETTVRRNLFSGDRAAIRAATVDASLALATEALLTG
ncbi:CinA family protein [Muricoccus pecuniae]|uniref:Nicotinamide-nucleotide amidase n=1 Tax=Muricoccus pecuniae TaxID=693023 RepID=A0A840YHX3_9PROT|nr:nicotinamide-nucleotide amidohydrolase family protein [Roseomonas pecuniae]MBB5693484.1 nicotinamide-nucleotide amidase [Roseomonas pecuniae]